ncbi:unnamed protein product [Rotaria magnacalcarata]|uniref:Reverse transcriptase domain-containing protein n=2 Tax=Rotaria TaxID=231623 RepID=A0A816PAS7_9BILA|nr:unnamed protein product [Rotaria magnacalcarata]
MHRLITWNFSTKDQKLVISLLDEWYSGRTLNTVLEEWEKVGISSLRKQKEYLKILCYNVEGWGTRAVEAIDLVYKVQASICIFTEVGELWNTCRLPHFNTFYQKGTNKNGGVCIAVGKHLKATRIEINIPNTVIIDITGLSEPVRIIGIYWPTSQQRDLDEIQPFVIEGTILSGDFNATVKEWNSPITDRRGACVREWINENNLNYITPTTNTSKRSLRNIDLSFSNMSTISSETLCFGTSDHWPILLSCENIFFDTNVFFPHTIWKVFEAVLALVQIFWTEEQKKNSADEWYKQYIRFIAAVKNRVTNWKERDKYEPSLPAYIIEKLKEIRKVRNRYYHSRHKGVFSEETRVLLRTMTRESKVDIAKHKNTQWQNFLSNIQTSYDKSDKAFWTHLSRIYKSRSLPFYKLSEGTKIISTPEGITNELFQYYSEQFKVPAVDCSNEHEDQIDRKYKELVNRLSVLNDSVEKTSIAEITRIIKTLKPKKSAGLDSVSNFIIKKLPPSYIECLAKCFNTWLNECRYPDDWKIAKIITLNKLKSGIPKCEQTRPISLLATHSKLFEKVLLLRIRQWAETNRLVPPEQSGFRPKCLLPTRVLSIYQEVKSNMAANIPTLALYVDYQKAYDRVWHAALLCKLEKMGMPFNLLKMTNSWLEERKAYVEYGEKTSKIFNINIGLPQGSSLSPYLFIVFHSDLTNYLGAHSCHLFADDLCVLIKPPIMKKLGSMIDYLEKEGTRVCNQVFMYSKKWKQPLNVSKTVIQLFHTQVKRPIVNVTIDGNKIELVKEFKYLGFTWTDKLSLKPTVDKIIGNIQRSLGKLKWIKSGRRMSCKALRQCFFAYTFPHFAWLFPLFPLLPVSQQHVLEQKFRVGLRLVHRCPFVSAHNLLKVTSEQPLQFYVKKYIQRRLKTMFITDLGSSAFYEDIFGWDNFCKRKNDHLGHFFRTRRVRQLKDRHESFLLTWLAFVDAN